MAADITQYLLSEGPKLTGDILRFLEKTGLSPELARKRLSRRDKTIKTLSGISFHKNSRFYFHESQYRKDDYWGALHHAVTSSSPAYHSAIASLMTNGGIVPKFFFPIISGAPIKQKGQIGSENILSRLSAVGILQHTEVGGMPTIQLNPVYYDIDAESLTARLTVQQVLLSAIADWARKLGIVSYDAVKIRSKNETLPIFGTHAFDLCGPSYLAPLTSYNKDKIKPGFLVCDAYLGEVDLWTAKNFIRKCINSRALRNLPPFLPVIIADGFHPDAFNELRKRGIIATKPSTLFGAEVAKGLAGLLATLTSASAIAVKKPEVIEILFSQLGHIEGAASNLRGALFELIVGHMVSLEGSGQLNIGQKAQIDEKTSYEIDVFFREAANVRLIECKGYAPTHLVNAEEVELWINEKASRLNKFYRNQTYYQGRDFIFEFWTSGKFTEDARRLGDKQRRYGVRLVDGKEIQKRMTKLNIPGIKKVFSEHYTNHPLSKLERKFGEPDFKILAHGF